jgi:hypothetical protein
MPGKTTEAIAAERPTIRLEMHRLMVQEGLSESKALARVLPDDRNRTKKLRRWKEKGLWPVPESELEGYGTPAVENREAEILKKIRTMIDKIQLKDRVGLTAPGRESSVKSVMIALRIPTTLDEDLKRLGGVKSRHVEKAITLYVKAMKADESPQWTAHSANAANAKCSDRYGAPESDNLLPLQDELMYLPDALSLPNPTRSRLPLEICAAQYVYAYPDIFPHVWLDKEKNLWSYNLGLWIIKKDFALEHLFTTLQLLTITGLNGQTFPAWVRKGWVPPYTKGGGRGKPNVFDSILVAWALALNEIFRIWPYALTPTYLWDYSNKGDKLAWKWSDRLMLSDGKTITKYLRKLPSVLPLSPVSILLTTGYVTDNIERLSNERFAEIRIAPIETDMSLVKKWLNTTVPTTYIPETSSPGSIQVVQCAAFINFTQLWSMAETMSSKL